MIEMIDDVMVEQEDSPHVAAKCSCQCNCTSAIADDDIGATGDDKATASSGAYIATQYDING